MPEVRLPGEVAQEKEKEGRGKTTAPALQMNPSLETATRGETMTKFKLLWDSYGERNERDRTLK